MLESLCASTFVLAFILKKLQRGLKPSLKLLLKELQTPHCLIHHIEVTGTLRTRSTALSMPRFNAIGFAPAATHTFAENRLRQH
jgi:hypothetical protein